MNLYQLIAYVETKGALAAVRFEPGVFAKTQPGGGRNPAMIAILGAIRAIHTKAWGTECSWGTAAMIYSSSFGAVQMMGFNLYGVCAYIQPFNAFLTNGNDQSDTFDIFIASKHLADCTPENLASESSRRLNFAKTYNGSIDYANGIIDALTHFGLAVKQ